MRVLRFVLVMSMIGVIAACDALPDRRSAELARLELERMELQELNRELSEALAERTRAVVSPEEARPPASARPVSSARPVVRRASSAPRPAPRPASEPLGRPAYEPLPSGGGTYSPSAPQPRVVTVKNTKRDAAIGAGAGAVIGATVAGRRSRVKGALIGAAVGAAAGAVVGSTVDTSTRVEY